MPLLHRVGEHAEDDEATAAEGTSGNRPITRDGFSSRAMKEDQNETASSNRQEETENIMGGPLSC